MLKSKKQKSSREVHHARKFRLHIGESRDTQCAPAYTQPPGVNAERVILHGVVMDGRGFGQNQWNFLVLCYTTPTD